MAKPAGTGRIEVRGLAEFQRALRGVETTLPRELRKANKEAAELIADAARERATSLGGVAAKSAPAIKAQAEQRAAKISVGGARFPFALGANFGSHHDLPRNTARGTMLGWNQFPPAASKDRFLYWAIGRKRDEFIGEYQKLLGELERKAFPSGGPSVEVQ